MNIKWIEEPFNPEDLESYKKLRKFRKLKIAIGESFTSYNEFKNVILNDLCDIIQIDVTQIGIKDAINVFNLSKKKGKKVAMHVWGSPISYLSNLNFAIAFNIDYFESPLVEYKFLNKYYKKYTKIEKGKIYFKKNFFGTGINLKKIELKKNKFIKNSGFKING